MGIVFSNGFAVGTNPTPMNVNVHDWIIYSGDYVPAYENGWITIPDHANSICLSDPNSTPNTPDISLYINIKNSAGFEQYGNLIGLVGNHTHLSFSWGTSDFVTFNCTADAFKYVDIGAGIMNIIYDQTYISNPSSPNSITILDSSESPYNGEPIRISYSIITSNIPTPTPTPTPTPGPTLYSFNISGWYANDIDACSGNANITAYSTNNSYPQMGDIIYTDNTGTTTYGAGFYLTVYGNTIELDSSGVIIGGPNSC